MSHPKNKAIFAIQINFYIRGHAYQFRSRNLLTWFVPVLLVIVTFQSSLRIKKGAAENSGPNSTTRF